jgi:hypothetical protein
MRDSRGEGGIVGSLHGKKRAMDKGSESKGSRKELFRVMCIVEYVKTNRDSDTGND